LGYSNAFANMLFQEVLGMEESTTYQAIVKKGRLAEARKFLLLIAEDKFGPPSEDVLAAINALDDADQLEQLGRCVNKVTSWEA
jgi:hypothetical protein